MEQIAPGRAMHFPSYHRVPGRGLSFGRGLSVAKTLVGEMFYDQRLLSCNEESEPLITVNVKTQKKYLYGIIQHFYIIVFMHISCVILENL